MARRVRLLGNIGRDAIFPLAVATRSHRIRTRDSIVSFRANKTFEIMHRAQNRFGRRWTPTFSALNEAARPFARSAERPERNAVPGRCAPGGAAAPVWSTGLLACDAAEPRHRGVFRGMRVRPLARVGADRHRSVLAVAEPRAALAYRRRFRRCGGSAPRSDLLRDLRLRAPRPESGVAVPRRGAHGASARRGRRRVTVPPAGKAPAATPAPCRPSASTRGAAGFRARCAPGGAPCRRARGRCPATQSVPACAGP